MSTSTTASPTPPPGGPDDGIDATHDGDPTLVYCGHCTGELDARYYFCPWCGHAIDG